MAGNLLKTAEAAERVRKPEATLRYWRHIRFGPPSFKIGGTVVYDEDALEQWIAEQRAKEPA